MPGPLKSLVALLCCLVVVGCSGASEAPVAEPPAETPAVEVTPKAEPQPEDPTAASPGESVDPAALLEVVQSATEGVETATYEEKEEYTLDGVDLVVRKRDSVDLRDPDRPLMRHEPLNSFGNEMIFAGDKIYVNGRDGWELMDTGVKPKYDNAVFVVAAKVLEDATEAVYIGQDEVGDFATRHYELKVDQFGFTPSWQPVEGDKIIVGLWLNNDNVPVKIAHLHKSTAIKTDEIYHEYLVTTLDPVEISVPD